ncbi:MAG: hypothetical protein PUF71_04475 [Firmicutes bacterium]|nr:hypothetical protein [Bacillota bacterium]
MKVKILITVITVCALLCSCGMPPSPQSATTDTSQSSVETTSSPIPETTTESSDIPSYEVYFSNDDSRIFWNEELCCWALQRDDYDTLPYLVSVEDGKEIVVIDRESGTQSTLFLDPFSRIAPEIDIWGDCVFFLAAVNETHDGIYRIYLPDGTVDPLFTDIPVKDFVTGFFASSNHGVNWTVWDEDFLILCEEKWDSEITFLDSKTGQTRVTTARDVIGNGRDYSFELAQKSNIYFSMICRDYYSEQPFTTKYHYDAMTGNLYSIRTFAADSDAHFAIYPNGETRTAEEYDENGMAWWDDSYYGS